MPEAVSRVRGEVTQIVLTELEQGALHKQASTGLFRSEMVGLVFMLSRPDI